jgi:CRISPR-associated endonuclease/helicase Cas3
MMEPLAHSARPKRGIAAQLYRDHVRGVVDVASRNAREAARYWQSERDQFVDAVRLAAAFHDLGKLEQANQKVLSADFVRQPLPVHHWDAGAAHLLNPADMNPLAAALVYAHHIGLPDFADQYSLGPGGVFRDPEARNLTEQELGAYLEAHEAATGSFLDEQQRLSPGVLMGVDPLALRIALSCLVDADHQDTASHCESVVVLEGRALVPELRLTLLDRYIASLQTGSEGKRNALRNEVYQVCRNADPLPGLYACDSPVGTGKTTAVMAHLLHAAKVKDLRRIFVVLPFTIIIDQSVKVYRRSLVGDDEPPSDVVAEHHHRAEFEDLESRHLSFLWKAPIVVTTAVQFFETLAANRPASLRKLHQLPGSAIFVDEAHAALPVHLWPQAWRWLRELESKWNCHLVLGSGSLNRFWELEEFDEKRTSLPQLVQPSVRTKVSRYEDRRIEYHRKVGRLNRHELMQWLPQLPGPRLLIVNTVQSAAAIADCVEKQFGRQAVEHMSTALCPRDREATLDRVKARLADSSDKDWTLVATSCVEAGVELSFRNGLRERCSLNSLVQVGGRVNRKGEYTDSAVWDFELQHDVFLKAHPAFDASARILGELFDEGKVCAKAATEAMRREIRQEGLKGTCDIILKAERNLQFPTVAEKFTVIDAATLTVIVDRELIDSLENPACRDAVDPSVLQRLSVQIWGYRATDYAVRLLTGYRGLYAWTLGYDTFLGYMAGVLKKLDHEHCGSII